MKDMAAKTGLAALPKAERKIASAEVSKRTTKVRADYAARELVDAGVALGATVAGAAIDHKFRKGAESEARLGSEGSKFRPPVNAVVGTLALGVGIWGALNRKRWAGTPLAVGTGLASPPLYSFVRNKLNE